MSEHINLLDEKVFNKYIQDIVYRNGPIQVFGSKEINSPEWVKENKNIVTNALIFKYLKLQLRGYLANYDAKDFLPDIEISGRMPDWAKEISERGDKVVNFDASNVPGDLREKIIKISIFLQSYAEKYIDQQLVGSGKIEMGGLSTIEEIKTFKHALSMYRAAYFGKGKKQVSDKIVIGQIIKNQNQND
ncbi:MAG TPA: hypothetical protein PKJ33_01440 [Alphaproteobacteria bacterium]|nr:hypothetical protein [Alphaproteobacteria bacterium]